MPIVADNITETTTISVPQPALDLSVTLSVFVITQVTIGLPPNDAAAARILVQLERGYLDGKNDFVSVQTSTIELRGAELLSVMGEKVTDGLTHYEDFKQAIYAKLQARGDIPSGSVV